MAVFPAVRCITSSAAWLSRGWGRLGRSLGLFYAVGIVIGCMGIGNMFQSNQAFAQIVDVTGGETSWLVDKGWLVGVLLAIAVGAVILGGIQSIARVTSRLVPFMAGLYLIGAFVILAMNAEAIPWAFGEIIGNAFGSQAMTGRRTRGADRGLPACHFLQRSRNRFGHHRAFRGPNIGADDRRFCFSIGAVY